MNPEERPSKREAFNAFFGEGWVSIHLDARRDGVRVPDEFSSNRHLVLQYGQNMPIPIPDLKVDDLGITATLSFSRTPHRTFVPWGAVYIVACNDGRGILYYEDVPEDVSFVARPIDAKTGEPLAASVLETDGELDIIAGQGQGEDQGDEDKELDEAGVARRAAAGNAEGDAGANDPEATKVAKRKRPVKRERLLKSVPLEPSNSDGGEPAAEPAPARRRKRPQLRVVK